MHYNKLVIGISGASGAIYGVRLLEILKALKIETHLVISKAAKLTMAYELDKYTFDQVLSIADYYYNNQDIGATIASGSFLHDGMIIAPCSIKSMSEIAHGTASSLLTRAADVTLKERRKLVLMLRETPLHAGHIQNMLQLTNIGGIIAPPLNAFYIKPQKIEDLIDYSVFRVLDLFNIKHDMINRWKNIEK